MEKHFTLYYLLLEDMLMNPMSPERNEEIRKVSEQFYLKVKSQKLCQLQKSNEDIDNTS